MAAVRHYQLIVECLGHTHTHTKSIWRALSLRKVGLESMECVPEHEYKYLFHARKLDWLSDRNIGLH